MTEQQSEWGPWIQHDGKGCPCVGAYAEVDHFSELLGLKTGLILPSVVGEIGWDGRPSDSNVIRFRIRKPRALLDLIQMIADLPAPTTTPAPGVIA